VKRKRDAEKEEARKERERKEREKEEQRRKKEEEIEKKNKVSLDSNKNEQMLTTGSITAEQFLLGAKEETRVAYSTRFTAKFTQLTLVESISDYQRYFQPFHVRQGIIVAPLHQFTRNQS
jgi:hypothetical protein